MAPLRGPWSQFVLLAFFWHIHSPGIPPWHVKQGQGHIEWWWFFDADFSIPQESPLLFWNGHFSFLNPAGSFSFSCWNLPVVLELETNPSSLSPEKGQKPWHCTYLLRQAGRLSPTLLAKFADSVDLKDGLLKNRVCTVKFLVVESYFSCNTTHTV